MKTAVLTGASSDIGKAITAALDEAGWRIIPFGRPETDLADLEAVAIAGEALAKEFVVIDAIIHVAGVWHDEHGPFKHKDLEDFTAGQIAVTMNVGVTSFMILCAKLLPVISREGSIVAISGTFASGASGWLPYYTSKRALEDFVVGLADDYPNGPHIYGISPADTATAPYRQFYPEDAKDAQDPAIIGAVVAKLVSEPEYKSGHIVELRGGHAAPGYHV